MKKLLLILLCLPLLFTTCTNKGDKLFKNYNSNYLVAYDIYQNNDKREFVYFHEFKDEYGKMYFNSWDGVDDQIPMFTVLIDDVLASEIRKYESQTGYAVVSDEFKNSDIFTVLVDCISENGLYQANIHTDRVPNQRKKEIDDFHIWGLTKPGLGGKMELYNNINKVNTLNVICDCSGISKNNLSYISFNGEKRTYEDTYVSYNGLNGQYGGEDVIKQVVSVERWRENNGYAHKNTIDPFSNSATSNNNKSNQITDKNVSNKEVESKIVDKKDSVENNNNSIEEDTEDHLIIGEIDDPDGYTNVRKEPISTSEIIYKIYEGESFFLLDTSSLWWTVISKNDTGFIHRSRVKITNK